MKKTLRLLAATAALGLAALAIAAPNAPVPSLDGAWWKIADNSPDISPYTYTPDFDDRTVDFTIFRASDGKWQLVACIRSTTYPGSGRLLYRWEGTTDLTAINWTPKGIFWTSAQTAGTTSGKIQAPHCFKEGIYWYMFWNSTGAAYCLRSTDGKTFANHTAYNGSLQFYQVSRDTMVFDDRTGVTGKWIAYFLDNKPDGSGGYMVSRQASALEGPWSAQITVVNDTGKAESPFVFKRGDWYYLMKQLTPHASADPLKFDAASAFAAMGSGRYATEILLVDGQYYVAGYGNGVWISKLKWSDGTGGGTSPVFTTQPASQVIAAGSTATFNATATGTPPPALQWQQNGVNLAGATGATLAVTGVEHADSGTYVCTATNTGGTVASTGALLTVTSTETFAGAALPSTFANGAFAGVGGLAWTYNGAKLATTLTSPSCRLRAAGTSVGDLSASAPGGVKAVSVTYRAATTAGNGQLELYLDGTLHSTSVAVGTTASTFVVTGLDYDGATTVRLKSVGPGEVVVDDLAITSNP
jgi:hypothetical protein